MSSSEVTNPTGRPDEIRAVPVRRPGRWIAAVIVLVIAAALVRSVIVSPGFEWGVVGEYLFDHRILEGLVVTIPKSKTDPEGAGQTIGIPYGMRYATSGLAQIRDELEEAAAVSGADWTTRFLRIYVPLLMPSLVRKLTG